ncbi:hypothetical protein DFH06DRAFT_1152572 [Mycena polygramma]|nr:hypothetical protein DFH06DRAFT_1152572 [Mycena polygramma]
MRFTKTKDDTTIFYGPDYYTLWLHVDGLTRCNWSPLVIIGQHRGSAMDGDAPTWTHKLEIGQAYRFAQPQAFMAEVFCGLTSLRVGDARENAHGSKTLQQKLSLKMQEWAIANSEPGNAQKIAHHCARLSAHPGGVHYVQGEGSERYNLADPTPPRRWSRLIPARLDIRSSIPTLEVPVHANWHSSSYTHKEFWLGYQHSLAIKAFLPNVTGIRYVSFTNAILHIFQKTQ